MGDYRVASMEEKKADNKITRRDRIIELDNKIVKNKKTIKKLNEVEEGIKSLRKSIGRCIDLLSYSMSGENVDKLLSKSNDANVYNSKKMIETLDEIKYKTKKEIKKLDKEREKIELQKEE